MASRPRNDRVDRAAPTALPDRPAPSGAARLPIVAALRFCGLGFDTSRMTELRRRVLCAPAEGGR